MCGLGGTVYRNNTLIRYLKSVDSFFFISFEQGYVGKNHVVSYIFKTNKGFQLSIHNILQLSIFVKCVFVLNMFSLI